MKNRNKDTFRSGGVISSGTSVGSKDFISEGNRQILLKEVDLFDENLPCGYHSINYEGRFVFMNETELKWLGYRREELIGRKKIFDIITPDSQEIISCSLASLIGRGWVRDVKFEFVRKDGSILPVLMNSLSSRDSLGNFVSCKSVVIEITDLKRAEDSLKERLYRVSKKNLYEDIIVAVTKSIHQSLDLQEVMENAVEAMSQNMGSVDNVCIYLVEGQEAVMKSYKGYPDWFVERLRRIPYPKGFTWKTILEGRALYCPDTDEDEVIGPAGREMGTKSYASMPIRFEGKTIGCIDINSLEKNAFDEEELILLEVVAQQIEIAIGNARQAQALKVSEEKFRNLVEQTNDWVWEIDKNGVFIYTSPQVYEILGYKPEEVLGKTTFDFMASNEAKRFLEIVESFIQKNEPFARLEKVLTHKNGSPIVLETSGSPVFDGTGRPQGYRGIARDVTERKQKEEAIDRLRRKKELILNSAGEGIFGIDHQGKIVFVNPAAARMTGRAFEELIGKIGHEILHHSRPDGTPYHIEDCPICGVFKNGVSKKGDDEFFWRSDRTNFPVEYVTTPIHEGGKLVGAVVTFSDITDRKRREEDLKSRNRDLQILNEITQEVHRSLDLERIYRVALDMVVGLEYVDIAMVYLVNDERDEAILKAHANVAEDYVRRAGRISYPRGITWKVIEGGKVYNHEDVQMDPDLGAAGRDLFHHSVLGIPITSDENVIGVIWFLSYKERKFQEREINLLTSVGNQISEAIVKARLYDEISKKKRYEEIINMVTRSAHRSLDLEEVMKYAVNAVSKNIFGAENVGIYLIEGEEAVLKAYQGFHHEFIDQIRRIPYPRGFIWRTIIEGKPRYCPDVDQDTTIGPVGKRAGTKSYVSMPIRFEEKTIGALGISSFLVRNAFNEEELKLLEMVVQQIEIAMNNARKAEMLRESEDRFRKLSESVRVIPWEKDPVTHSFIYVGPQVVEILGYPIEDWHKDGFWIEHMHLDDRYRVSSFCEESSQKFDDYEIEYRMVTADGRVIWLLDLVNVKREGDTVRSLRGMIIDITERKEVQEELQAARDELEKRVTERTLELTQTNKTLEKEIYERTRAEDQISKSLKEKEVLLKEIHHRVKNNLQVISSLLSIQSRSVGDRGVQEIFNESNNRVKSMALIHEQLYKAHDLGSIDCGEYVKNLVAHIFGSYRVDIDNINYRVMVQEMSVDIDTAMNCGLIIGELVSNSLKHAFPPDRVNNKKLRSERSEREVTIELRSDNYGRVDPQRRLYTLIVSNNGEPFPEDLDFENAKTLGLQLVKTMVEQLDGDIELKRGEGTSFKITF
jgi:PAS domain S-box-containing protein